MNFVPLVSPSGRAGASEKEVFEHLYQAAHFQGKLITVSRFAQRAAALFPAKDAFIYKDTTLTYSSVYAKAIRVSMHLRSMGVKARDRVVLLWENSPEFFIAYYGIVQLGAVVAPLNVYLTEAEILHIVKDATPAAFIISDEQQEKIKNVHEHLPPLISQAHFQDLIADVQQPEPFEITDLEPEEMAVLLYTSGTTGFPKGVMTSSKNIVTNVLQGIARIPLGQHERVFGILPLFHSFAQFTCVWGAFLVGCTVILVPRIERRYLLEGLTHKPTLFLAVPTLFGLLALLKRAPLESVKFFVSGGDAMPDKIRAAFELIYRRKIGCGYGLTETTPLIAADIADELYRTSTVGRLVYGMQASVRDENGQEVAAHEIGELWVKGDNVMLGYYNAPEQNAKVFKDGWFCTGDLAYFDHQQRLVITGRSKDLIVNKGFKIYPQEIENVIMQHPAVLRVGVVGQKVSATEQVPVAFVQVREVSPAIEHEIKQLCAKNLAPYKNPRQFVITAKNLPATATGKVDKKRLFEFLKEEK